MSMSDDESLLFKSAVRFYVAVVDGGGHLQARIHIASRIAS